MTPWKTAQWTFGVLVLAACQTNTSVETSIEATLDRLQHEDRTNAILAIVPDALDQARGLKERSQPPPLRTGGCGQRQHPYQGHGHHRRIPCFDQQCCRRRCPVVARLRDAGAHRGKQICQSGPIFDQRLLSGWSSVGGLTTNPFDPSAPRVVPVLEVGRRLVRDWSTLLRY